MLLILPVHAQEPTHQDLDCLDTMNCSATEKLEGLRVKGMIVAALTPFTDDGALNLAVINDYVDYLVKKGAAGAFVAGSTGEGLKMSVSERKQVLEEWIQAGAGRLKIIAHIGSESASDCKELAIHAESVHADAIAVMAPSYFKPATVDNLLLYLRDIASCASSTPLYYYCFGDQWSIDEFLQLAEKQLPTLCGIKYSHTNLFELSSILQYSGGKYEVMYGVDEQLIGALAMGAKACVGSTYNYMPELTLRLIAAFEVGDIEKSREEQYRSQAAIKIFMRYAKQHGGIAGTGKAIMKMIGLDFGPPRPPEKTVSAGVAKQLQAELELIGFFKWK